MGKSVEKTARVPAAQPAARHGEEPRPRGQGTPAAREDDAAVIFQQREIERLLSEEPLGEADLGEGMKAILSPALVSYERLPMLDVVFERLADRLDPALRRFTGGAVEVRLEKIASARFASHMGSLPLSSLMGVVKATEWHNQILATFERDLVFAALDALLGGGQAGGRVPAEGRRYTSIEQNLMRRVLQVVLDELAGAFAPLTEVAFQCQRIECNPRFASIARDVHATVVVTLKVVLGGRGGRMELLLPYGALEPIRHLLMQSHVTEPDCHDTLWQRHLSAALDRTEVPVQAVLAADSVTLGEVLGWREGSRVLLNADPDTPVSLRCGEATVFEGQMRRAPGRVTVEILGKSEKEETTS